MKNMKLFLLVVGFIAVYGKIGAKEPYDDGNNCDIGDICQNHLDRSELNFQCADVASRCNDCEDRGCREMYGKYAFCLNLRDFDGNPGVWQFLESWFDLNSPIKPGLCQSSSKEDCCRCIIRKKCYDVGCKQKFKGNGVCIDLKEGDLTQYDLDFSVPPESSKDLCWNVHPGQKDDCCSCFKKKTPTIEDCTWTGWQDLDNPSGKCDCEVVPDGCNVQKYEIQMVTDSTTYTDVSLVPFNNMGERFNADGTIERISCINRDQPGCPVTSHGYVTCSPYNPVSCPCCRDYKVNYCCGPPKPKDPIGISDEKKGK